MAPCEAFLAVVKQAGGCSSEIAESMEWKKQNMEALLAELDRLKPNLDAAIETMKSENEKVIRLREACEDFIGSRLNNGGVQSVGEPNGRIGHAS
jgi:hypothetical protein